MPAWADSLKQSKSVSSNLQNAFRLIDAAVLICIGNFKITRPSIKLDHC